jgi:acyl-CoA synthetase (NDP forming)
VAFRVVPLSRADANEMIEEVHGKQLLGGARGKPRADREALVTALLSVSHMLAENPRISELDINPLLVLERGVVALDARAVVSNEQEA